MARHNELGKWGEDLACDKLVGEGYAIVERNWRSGHNEIDIIAARGNRIVFAEVKTRSETGVDPLEAIDANKISRLTRAAHSYIVTHDIKQEPQFDVFAISGNPADYKLEHIPDAFFPPLRNR